MEESVIDAALEVLAFRGGIQRYFASPCDLDVGIEKYQRSSNHEHEKDAHRKMIAIRLINLFFNFHKQFRYEKHMRAVQ